MQLLEQLFPFKLVASDVSREILGLAHQRERENGRNARQQQSVRHRARDTSIHQDGSR